MLSERERQALEEIEREVSAQDPHLAASLRTETGKSSRWSQQWPYTAMAVVAWALAAGCLLLGLPMAMLGAAALGVSAVALRRWRFRYLRSERGEPSEGSEDDDPPDQSG